MQAMVCELCGSNDIVKKDGLYICQHCGTKYSIEEAKKLIGTIKIDKSEETKNFLLLARRALDNKDYEVAAKYYDSILQQNPDSWEAAFYNVYCRAMDTNILNIAPSVKSVSNCLNSVFVLIKNLDNIADSKAAIIEISARISYICAAFESVARNHFKTSANDTSNADLKLKYTEEYHSRSIAVANLHLIFGDYIKKYYSNELDMMKIAVVSWKSGVQYYVNDSAFYDNFIEDRKMVDNRYGAMIREFEPDYVMPAPNYDGFPEMHITIMKDREKKSGIKTDDSSGGCYVATAVYGSYDCPEVWTLRRFRDYTLAKTWYGRSFIKAYYAISPTLVKWFGKKTWFKLICRKNLDKMVDRLHMEGIENTPYRDKQW